LTNFTVKRVVDRPVVDDLAVVAFTPTRIAAEMIDARLEPSPYPLPGLSSPPQSLFPPLLPPPSSPPLSHPPVYVFLLLALKLMGEDLFSIIWGRGW